MRLHGLILLAAVLALSDPARAGTVRPWIGINGSWDTYSMGDVNRELVGQIDDQVRPYGYRLRDIEDGFGVGGTLGVSLPGDFDFGIGYDRLSGSTDLLLVGALVTINAPANALRAFASYRPPLDAAMAFHLRFAAGIVSEAGGVDIITPEAASPRFKMTGTGPLFEGSLGSEFRATPQFGFEASLGYRHARVGRVKAKGSGLAETMLNPDGSYFSIDYSGLFLRLGFKAALKK